MTIRIYQSCALSTDQEVELDKAASHHLTRVLRAHVGDAVTLFNGSGVECHGVISAVHKQRTTVQCQHCDLPAVESPCQIHLYQAIGKGERMDVVMQKATELGVSSITPLISDYVNVRLNADRLEKKIEHWQKVIISACEQSGRVRLPVLHPTIRFDEWLAQPRDEPAMLFEPSATQTLHQLPQQVDTLHIAIGPEGGFSPAEVDAANQAKITTLKLGPRILRMETAAITAISLCQYHYGDL